jgi:hypothetical protein
MDLTSKIQNLLRLARDQAGSPEGDTAKKLAESLMDKHGLEVDIDDVERADIEQDWIVQVESPVPWMEMLLVSLCDLMYGGTVLPMQTPNSWRLYVVSDRGTVNLEDLSKHFNELVEDIEDLSRSDVIRTGQERNADSYALGAVYGISEKLYELMLGRAPQPEQMPFMYDKALSAAEAENPAEVEQAALAVEAQPRAREGFVEILPNWPAFHRGRKDARIHLMTETRP